MREEDKRSLALVLAGAVLGFVFSIVFTPLSSISLVVSIGVALSLLLYGAGTLQQLIHERRLHRRWNAPLRIGILADLGWDPTGDQITSWTDVSPNEWKAELESQAGQRKLVVSVETTKTKSTFDGYVAVLNPYGGVYPEDDLRNFATLHKIIDYVREGGLFVNVADIPSYWAYNQDMHRRLDVAEPVYGLIPTPSGLQPYQSKPFDRTPLARELGLRLAGVDPPQQPVKFTLDGRQVLSTRFAIVDDNVIPCVSPTKLTYVDGKPYDMTPFFYVNYGTGEFLISLTCITHTLHTQPDKDAIKSAICERIIQKLDKNANS